MEILAGICTPGGGQCRSKSGYMNAKYRDCHEHQPHEVHKCLMYFFFCIICRVEGRPTRRMRNVCAQLTNYGYVFNAFRGSKVLANSSRNYNKSSNNTHNNNSKKGEGEGKGKYEVGGRKCLLSICKVFMQINCSK